MDPVVHNILRPAKNVGNIERVLSGFVGAGMLKWGLRHGGAGGWLTAILGGALIHRGVTGNCKMYQSMGVSTASAVQSDRISVRDNRGIRVEKTFFVQRAPEELFRTWRNFENLPHFMKHLESVRVLDDKRSHWTARGPAGTHVEWDAEVINEHENEMIAWRSLAGADVDSAGTVRFRPVAGGTEVRIALEYNPPGGALGAAVARLFHEEPSQQIEDDMRRFKQMMEAAG